MLSSTVAAADILETGPQPQNHSYAGSKSAAYSLSQSRSQPRPQSRPQSRPSRQRPTSNDRRNRVSREDIPTQKELTSRSFQRELRANQRAAAKLIRRIETENPKKRKQTTSRKKLKEQYGLAFVEMPGGEILARHGEILGVNLSGESRRVVLELGFTVMRQTVLEKIGITLDLLRIPAGMSMKEALEAVRAADQKSHYDYNMAYAPAAYHKGFIVGNVPQGEIGTRASSRDEQVKGKNTVADENRLLVGMIDTGVNAEHKSLGNVEFLQGNVGRGPTVTPRDHGTAVASILARGRPARIIAIDVFSGPAAYADAESIVIALEFLARQNVGVINMSVAGPNSPLLAQAVKNLIKQGYIIVAAVGNEGPAGPERFPAAQSGVVGVTAVDGSFAVFEMANQGEAVDYAALGVQIEAASVRGQKKYSGTSFAAPIVSAFLANRYQHPDTSGASKALLVLDRAVTDLGPEGPDGIFGRGFLANQEGSR